MIWLRLIVIIFSVLAVSFLYKDYKNGNFSKKALIIISIMEAIVIIISFISLVKSL